MLPLLRLLEALPVKGSCTEEVSTGGGADADRFVTEVLLC
jgi:hypothetical protein